MSISLSVRVSGTVELDKGCHLIGDSLREVLDLSFVPQIYTQEFTIRPRASGEAFEDGILVRDEWVRAWVPLGSQCLIPDDRSLGFCIRGEPELVSVLTIEGEPGYRSIEEPTTFLLINVVGDRTPLELALAAAVAHGFSREFGTDVIDDWPFFSDIFDQSANSFLNSVKIRGPFDDYRVAADLFRRQIDERFSRREAPCREA